MLKIKNIPIAKISKPIRFWQLGKTHSRLVYIMHEEVFLIEKPIKISKVLTVGPEPTKDFLKLLKNEKYGTIINLCKKGEMGQINKPLEEQEIVEELGLDYIHMPISVGSMKTSNIEEFVEVVNAAKKPVYVHCRIGQRSGPFALIYHAIRNKVKAEKVFEKASSMGLTFSSPFLSDFIEKNLKLHGLKEAS